MSIFYVSADVDGESIKYILDSTSRIRLIHTGTPTKLPVSGGASGSISDNYVNQNVKLSFTGKVSDIKAVSNPSFIPSRTKNPANFVEGEDKSKIPANAKSYLNSLVSLKERKIPFTIAAGDIGTFPNCLFTTLSVEQDKGAGTTNGISTFKVSFAVSQIRFGSRAEIAAVRDAQVANDFSKVETKAGTKKEREVPQLGRIESIYGIDFSSEAQL